MNTPIKLPYSISNFKDLITQGYYYVDKTKYIEALEGLPDKIFFFLRPRRFGKSLFISTLHYYYGLEHKATFQELFGKYYIGQSPTTLANTYLILRFEFTKIETSSKETTKQSFSRRVKTGIKRFFETYSDFFTAAEIQKTLTLEVAADLMEEIVTLMLAKVPNYKLYVLIDEYDHFTNELMAFRLEDFKDIVSKTGFVRKFYEAIKEGTALGVVDRFFATGVTPITLDSMTSGFNIATDLSLDLRLTKMMGFTETRVKQLFQLSSPEHKKVIEETMPLLQEWYDGYRFNEEVTDGEMLYNPNMVFYFLKEYQAFGRIPRKLLDSNIASDYYKIKQLVMIEDPEENSRTLNRIINGDELDSLITEQFSFARNFTQHDFISLLYYNGFLTIDYALGNIFYFRVPNYVIQKLYFDYFREILQQHKSVDVKVGAITSAVAAMAYKGNPQLFFDLIHSVLHQLANRDYQKFDEKYIKIIMMTYLSLTATFYVESERETPAGYLDLSFLEHPNIPIKHQYLLELKYLKKEEAKQLPSKQKEAKKQLLEYISDSPKFKNMKNLQAWTVVVVKDELEVERVNL